MSYQEQLSLEINDLLDELAEKGEDWDTGWIAQQICQQHRSGLNSDDHAEFWRYCGYRDCRYEVRRTINRRAGDRPEPVEEQLRLPGFQHLQAYYVVRRGDQDVGVPIDHMSAGEIEAKAALYRAMGKGCYDHADELERYLRQNRQTA